MISIRKKILSFIITAAGLLGLFLLAVNTGTLKVSPIELFNGLFVAAIQVRQALSTPISRRRRGTISVLLLSMLLSEFSPRSLSAADVIS